MNAREIIKKHGGKIVDEYSLINNWGYIVMIPDGTQYDVRRWANCYGSDCGWGVCHMQSRGGKSDENWVKAISRDLNDYELNSEW